MRPLLKVKGSSFGKVLAAQALRPKLDPLAPLLGKACATRGVDYQYLAFIISCKAICPGLTASFISPASPSEPSELSPHTLVSTSRRVFIYLPFSRDKVSCSPGWSIRYLAKDTS